VTPPSLSSLPVAEQLDWLRSFVDSRLELRMAWERYYRLHYTAEQQMSVPGVVVDQAEKLRREMALNGTF
jgi:hypothetical protein